MGLLYKILKISLSHVKISFVKMKKDLLTGQQSVGALFGTALLNIWESINKSRPSSCACVSTAQNTCHAGQRGNMCLT